MSRIIADRVRETSTTTGTGTLDLDGAEVGFQGFVAGAGDGAVVYYTIAGQEGGGAQGEWENGVGTITDAATDTLSRDTVLSSSNGGSAVNFSAGTKDVFISVPTEGMSIVVAVDEPSAASSVDLALPGSVFDQFQIHGWLAPATDDVHLYLRVSHDGGSTYDSTNEYGYSTERRFTGGGVNDTGGQTEAQIQLTDGAGASVGNDTGEAIRFTVWVDRALDADHTYFSYVGTGVAIDGNLYQFRGGGRHKEQNALTHIRLLFSSGNVADGKVTLIGIP